MIVVDTNVLVDVLRGDPRANAAVAERASGGVVVPSMVRYEILAGARPRKLVVITELFDECLDAPVDRDVADEAASLTRRYSRSHSGIDAIDYAVAATARLLGTEPLTRIVKHFPMFPGLTPPY